MKKKGSFLLDPSSRQSALPLIIQPLVILLRVHRVGKTFRNQESLTKMFANFFLIWGFSRILEKAPTLTTDPRERVRAAQMLKPKIAPENAKDVLEELEGLEFSATGGGALCSP